MDVVFWYNKNVKNNAKYIFSIILYAFLFLIIVIGAAFLIYTLINFNLFLNIFIGVIGVLLGGYCFFYMYRNINEFKEYIKLLKSMKKSIINISNKELESKLIELKYKVQEVELFDQTCIYYFKGNKNILFIDGSICPNYLKLSNYVNQFVLSKNLIHKGLIVIVYDKKINCKLEDMSRLNDSYNMLGNVIYLTLTEDKLCFNYVDDNCTYKIIDIYDEFKKSIGN